MPRRGGHQLVRSGSTRSKEWETVCLASSPLDLAIGTVLVFELFRVLSAETLLRTRGQIMASFDSSAVNEAATIAAGIAFVSTRALLAGAASVPRPSSEGGYPWLWHGWFDVSSVPSVGGASISGEGLVQRLMVDSKAMRKVKEDESMILAFEMCDSVDLGGNVVFSGGFRALAAD